MLRNGIIHLCLKLLVLSQANNINQQTPTTSGNLATRQISFGNWQPQTNRVEFNFLQSVRWILQGLMVPVLRRTKGEGARQLPSLHLTDFLSLLWLGFSTVQFSLHLSKRSKQLLLYITTEMFLDYFVSVFSWKKIRVLDYFFYVKYKDLCAAINPPTSKIENYSK